MTTTPAPTEIDLDAIEAYLCRPSHSVDRLHGHATQLLDALATEREAAQDAVRGLGNTISDLAHALEKAAAGRGEAEAERDAARKELAKTRAELAELQAALVYANEQLAIARNAAPEVNPATTAEPAGEPKATEPWRDFTIHTDWGNEQDVYVACRLDDVCEEVKHNPDERYLTLGEAVDWAKEHAASPFHTEPAAG